MKENYSNFKLSDEASETRNTQEPVASTVTGPGLDSAHDSYRDGE